ncbi:5-deoxy-glucuronate isomerase, partial [Paenibacillus xylanexedens]|uniref:5-deoxy-glucuronate isomerase n=1 Tax=Paenibacillus xylanexedens TaxID=528191 RepID=UPI0034D96CB8
MNLTPQSPASHYLPFHVPNLPHPHTLTPHTPHHQLSVLLLTPFPNLNTPHNTSDNIGKTMSVFHKIPPYSVYLSTSHQLHITPPTQFQIPISLPPPKPTYPPP